MGTIFVEGLGEVEIEGTSPTEEEQRTIIRELNSRKDQSATKSTDLPNIDLKIPGAGEFNDVRLEKSVKGKVVATVKQDLSPEQVSDPKTRRKLRRLVAKGFEIKGQRIGKAGEKPTPPTGDFDIDQGLKFTEQEAEARFKNIQRAERQRTAEFTRRKEKFGTSRLGAVALGATTGAQVGATATASAGPVAKLAGTVAGGTLGAAAGSLGFENLLDIGRRGGVKGLPESPSLGERVATAGREATFEAGASVGVSAIGPLARGGLRALGVRRAGVEAARAGKQAGVELGVGDVTESVIVRKFSQVLGKFPFVSTPVKRVKAEQGRQALKSFDRLMFSLGPTVDTARLGINMKRKGSAVFQAFRDATNKIYNDAIELGVKRKATANTPELKTAARDVVQNFRVERPKIRVAGKLQPKPTGGENPIILQAQQWLKLQGKITIPQLRGLADDLDQALAKAKNDGFKIKNGMALKEALENTIAKFDEAGNLVGSQINDPEVAKKFAEAADFFKRGQQTFETPTAQQFGRVTKNVFGVGLKKPGRLNEDELLRVAFNARSPQAMKDLKRLVGPRTVHQAVRNHIDEAWRSKAFRVTQDGKEVFDIISFEKAIGLDNPKGAKFKALQQALKGSGLRIEDLTAFTSTVKKAFRDTVPETSQFVARRVQLAGVRGLIRSLQPVAAGAGTAAATGFSVLPTVGFFVAVRSFSKLIADPKKMRLFTRAMNEEVSIASRRIAMVRLLRLGVLDSKELPGERTPDNR